MLTTEGKINNAIIWIDGLSKNRVKQGRKMLGDFKKGYCCLGYGCMKLNLDYQPHNAISYEFKIQVGLKEASGYFKNKYKGVNTLAALNDTLEFSFRRISTFIKKNLDSLFIEDVAEGLSKHYDSKMQEND